MLGDFGEKRRDIKNVRNSPFIVVLKKKGTRTCNKNKKKIRKQNKKIEKIMK